MLFSVFFGVSFPHPPQVVNSILIPFATLYLIWRILDLLKGYQQPATHDFLPPSCQLERTGQGVFLTDDLSGDQMMGLASLVKSPLQLTIGYFDFGPIG